MEIMARNYRCLSMLKASRPGRIFDPKTSKVKGDEISNTELWMSKGLLDIVD